MAAVKRTNSTLGDFYAWNLMLNDRVRVRESVTVRLSLFLKRMKCWVSSALESIVILSRLCIAV